MCDQQCLRSACTYTQSDQSLCLSLDYSMSVKLLTENHLEFLSLKGGCTGSSECTLVKTPHCWKSSVICVLLYHTDDVPWPTFGFICYSVLILTQMLICKKNLKCFSSLEQEVFKVIYNDHSMFGSC